jgi:20S proteasome subunit beta 2
MSASAEVRADTAFPHVQSGFSFENTRRNAFLHKMGGSAGSVKHHLPEATKTGTTIVGVCFKGGVVLGADTRATGSLVVDKDCDKIHYIADNIFCCGAGTAADTEMATAQVSSQLELLRLVSLGYLYSRMLEICLAQRS